jgi:hypothetical protein
MVRRRWLDRLALIVGLGAAACGSKEVESSTTGTGGGAGSGGASVAPATKLDILLMVDNSRSMADKQELLSLAVPRLLSYLVAPQSNIQPVTDLHIGVISSSLGGHGGSECAAATSTFVSEQNDLAHLMPSVRDGLTSYHDLGFLAWNPGETNGGSAGELASEFAMQVKSVGETGCGYEAQLESWYRFLVDPSPPAVLVVNPQTMQAEAIGVDSVVLQQRKDFLRPDSAVAIIMLTDENDCSMVDGDYYWVGAHTANPDQTAFHLSRGTSTCSSVPDGDCCRSCSSAESSPPEGCWDLASDSECQKGSYDDQLDHPNLRCWEQKRRFGMEFLYPTRKYAEALTQPRICPHWGAAGPADCTGEGRVPNPLLSGPDGYQRPKDRVFLVGIVGVPWQDLATHATLNDPNDLELSSAAELAQQGRWDWLIPRCKLTAANAELMRPTGLETGDSEICDRWDLMDTPDDPFMVESTVPRSGTNPATGAALQPPTAALGASAINGHEWVTGDSDLQYACTFPLPAPRDCSTTSGACDCTAVAEPFSKKNPTCQTSAGYGEVQTHGGAFPGVRQLQVLHDIGNQAVVASICAKNTADTASKAYGYFAAMELLSKSLAPVLKAQ